MNNMKKLFLLTTLLILLIGVVSASEVSDDSYTNCEKVLDEVGDSTDLDNSVVNGNENTKSSVQTADNQITKNYNKSIKEANNNVYVNNYDEFAKQMNLMQQSKDKDFTINLRPGNYNATCDISVNTMANSHKVIINGNNITLDGKQLELFIGVLEGDTLELNDITIKNYKTSSSSMLYIFENCRLKLHNSKFININDDYLIYNMGNLSIRDSSFVNSTGMTINNFNGKFSINNSSFINNKVTSNYTYAGVIMMDSWNNQTFIINNTSFINNYNDGIYNHADVIYSVMDNGKVVIQNSKFFNNGIRDYPCIAISGKMKYEIVSCLFDNNNFAISNEGNLTLIDTKLSNHSYCTIANIGNLKINNCKFNNNKDEYGYNSVIINSATTTIYNSTFFNNSLVSAIDNRANMNIYNSKFFNNNAKTGGAILNKANLTLNNSILMNNTARNIVRWLDNSGETLIDQGQGGAIYNSGELKLIDSTISENHASRGDNIYFNMITINKISPKQYMDEFNISGQLNECINNHTNNIPLKVNLNGKMYDVKTDAKGFFNLNAKADLIGANIVSIRYEANETDEWTTWTSNITSIVTFNVSKKATKIVLNPITGVKVNNNVNVTGKFTDIKNNPLRYTPVKLKINNQDTTATTDANGIFSITFKATKEGTNNITASYQGNARYAATTTKTTFNVGSKIVSVIKINPIGNKQYSDQVIISGRFTDDAGNSLRYTPLNLVLNGNANRVTTDANGYYNFTTKASVIGKNNVTVSYAGNARYTASKQSVQFTVTKKNTKITFDKILTQAINTNVKISGKFTDNDGNSLRYTPVILKINNDKVTVKTDGQGVFTYTVKVTKSGLNNVTGSYNGNARYAATSQILNFYVGKATKLTVQTTKTVEYTDNIVIIGKFTDAAGNNLRYTPIKLTINGQETTVTTDAYGNYNYTIKATKVGTNTITASYNGNARYAAATTTITLSIVPKTTKISLAKTDTTDTKLKTITGKFTDCDGNNLRYTPLTIKINNQESKVTTDGYGNFKFTATINPNITNNITSSYAGNARYAATTTKISI